MTSHLFRLELRLLARERAAWVLLGLFAAALAYGLWNGARLTHRQSEAATALTQDAAKFQTQLREVLGKQSVDPKAIAGRGTTAVLPAAPLPLLATGQSDLSLSHETVVLWKLAAPADTRSELENPSHLMAGRFDLAFVLVWLFPLFLLALVYDLMAGDRESGTLRLALAQGIAPWGWMARRALARSLPMLTLAALATLTAGFFGGAGTRLALALTVVLAYGLFWVALALAVNAIARTAAGAATALGAAWVLLVLVAPTLLNVTVETLYPTPSANCSTRSTATIPNSPRPASRRISPRNISPCKAKWAGPSSRCARNSTPNSPASKPPSGNGASSHRPSPRTRR